MDKRKPVLMLIGRSQAGKTTLTQCLTKQKLRYNKTQTVQVVDGHFIDTPGEYVERHGYYGALSVTATSANIIGLVQSATEEGTMFAPGFGFMFCGKPVVGIVTKCDIATEKQIIRAEHLLRDAGATKCFRLSSLNGKGVVELEQWLNTARNSENI
ncbi:MAG: EutP/PduV family microcompartment system protein [Aminipila sp.]